MANNDKVSIDIEISGGGKDQVESITNAFDKLRSSINGLSNPLNTISSNINSLNNNLSKYNDSLSKVIDKNKDLAKTGGDASNKVSDMISSFVTWRGIIELVKTGLTGMEAALTGGLAVITTFAPEIIKFVSALFKGKDAIDQAKMSLSTLNGALEDTGYEGAIKQVSEFKIKIDLAKKGLIEKRDVVICLL